MEIKIEAKILNGFFKLISMESYIESMILQFEEGGLYCNSKDKEMYVMVTSYMPKSAFVRYDIQESIEVGINNSKLLTDIIGTMDGVITIEITSNQFIVKSDNKNAHIIISKSEFLSEFTFERNVELFNKFDTGITLPIRIFSDSVKNLSVLSAAKMAIQFKNGELQLISGEDNFNKIVERFPCNYKDVKANFLKEIYSKLVLSVKQFPEINVSLLRDDAPLLFSVKCANYQSKLLLAPKED